MPLQNRVSPLNKIVAYPEHGLFMGNRGCLHNDNQQIVRQKCSLKRWIVCLTSFKDRKRSLMSQRQYTELFFLDEATALAAGHRPCAECRRKDYRCFKEAWINGNPNSRLTANSSINKVDAWLHRDRLTKDGQQETYTAVLRELPSGTFFTIPNCQTPLLLWHGTALSWTPSGYETVPSIRDYSEVIVRTPRSTVNALRAGYIPVVHSTAED
ncbi:MAG: hypothetical protein QGG09_06720 [Pirellulaceae bacterium]|jgi:hypothetical protein|nr:hypothetical protein [Pirellulaceae bacterium]HJN12269.1 hypothetical protein [Pirellulaceae bacterium]